ncbi:hypothetical protein GCM10028867_44010 [Nocardioides pacificus]
MHHVHQAHGAILLLGSGDGPAQQGVVAGVGPGADRDEQGEVGVKGHGVPFRRPDPTLVL